jgi:hypothetical protein
MASAISPPTSETSQGRALKSGCGQGALQNQVNIPPPPPPQPAATSAVNAPPKWNNNSPRQQSTLKVSQQHQQAKQVKPVSRLKARESTTKGPGPCAKKNNVNEPKQELHPCHDDVSALKEFGLNTACSSTRTSSNASPIVLLSSSVPFRVCEDLLCSSDELRIFTEEGEEEERGGGGHLQEELEAELLEEKSSLIRETELGIKQEGLFSRLEAGAFNE